MEQTAPPFQITELQAGAIPILPTESRHAFEELFPATECYKSSTEIGEMFFYHCACGELDLWYSKYLMNRNTTLSMIADMTFIELRIAYQNNFVGSLSAFHRTKYFNISFYPYIDSTVRSKANESYATFDIHITRSFLENLMRVFPVLEKFLLKVENGIACDLCPVDLPCSVEMLQSIQHILHSNFSEAARKALIGHQLSALVMMALERISSYNSFFSKRKFSDAEVGKLHALRNYINEQYGALPTLELLAKKFATNVLVLKQGFRHLFGISVYQYYMDVKLRRAKLALEHSDEPVLGIALDAGYEYIPSFIAAFKNKFGCTPGYFRKHAGREMSGEI